LIRPPIPRRRAAVFSSVAAALIGLAVAAASGLRAAEALPGPVAGRVVRVVDGDTLVVRAHIWLGQEVETAVRLLGIDAPELKGRCPHERALAERARDRLAALVAGGGVVLTDIHYDKYGGRVLARVSTLAAGDLGQVLLAAGLARAYGGRARQPWCPDPDRG
jgi:endonuclease YncB( thermonuclease family)